MRFPFFFRAMRRKRIVVSATLVAASCALALPAAVPTPPGAEFLQALRLPLIKPSFGGLSAVSLSGDGADLTMLSDHGYLIEGRLLRNGGRIDRFEAAEPLRLRHPDGSPLRGRAGDSEGLAFVSDVAHIAFEGDHRVARHAGGGRTVPLASPPAFAHLPRNGGLEALAATPSGRLIAVAETGGGRVGFPVWFHDAGGWRAAGRVQDSGIFRPVGADVGPDGRLYLLERGFAGIGFASQVRVFDIVADGLTGGGVVLRTPLLRHGNLEGLSVWRDGTGALRLTMVSDDNFLRLQRAEIVEYRLPAPLARTGDNR